MSIGAASGTQDETRAYAHPTVAAAPLSAEAPSESFPDNSTLVEETRMKGPDFRRRFSTSQNAGQSARRAARVSSYIINNKKLYININFSVGMVWALY